MTHEIERLIEDVPWRATNYIEPHEYIVKTWDEKCAALVESIRKRISEQGYRQKFRGASYRYVNVDGYRYWVFKLVLNRARLGLTPMALSPRGYAAIAVDSGEVYEFDEAAARLPWRNNVLAPHEPRMPAHQYVVVQSAVLEDCRILEFIIDHHPETYSAYFRGYQHPTHYLEVGGLRYWRSSLNRRWFVNRCRPDSCEPPRRVDQGARPIPPEEWGAKYPSWPQGSGSGAERTSSGEWCG
jgi:hypothetical protein